MNSKLTQWRFATLTGLSLCYHLEQALDDSELAVVLEGWASWGMGHFPEGYGEDRPPVELAKVFAQFCADVEKADPTGTAIRERLIEVYESLGDK
jgi:hypothetical protein